MSNNDQHDNKELFEKVFDNVLDEALIKMARTPNPDLPDDEPVEFSQEHKNKIEQIFRQAKKREIKSVFRNNAKRIAICAAVLILLLGITAMSVGAVRNRILNFIHNTEETNSKFGISDSYDPETYSDDKISLGYIPHGFHMVKRGASYVEFSDDRESINIFVDSDSASGYIDTENAEVEYMTINSYDCYYIEKESYRSLVVYDNGTICTIQSGIDKEELIKIAQNLEIK